MATSTLMPRGAMYSVPASCLRTCRETTSGSHRRQCRVKSRKSIRKGQMGAVSPPVVFHESPCCQEQRSFHQAQASSHVISTLPPPCSTPRGAAHHNPPTFLPGWSFRQILLLRVSFFSHNKQLKSLLMFHKANNPGEDWMGDTENNTSLNGTASIEYFYISDVLYFDFFIRHNIEILGSHEDERRLLQPCSKQTTSCTPSRQPQAAQSDVHRL